MELCKMEVHVICDPRSEPGWDTTEEWGRALVCLRCYLVGLDQVVLDSGLDRTLTRFTAGRRPGCETRSDIYRARFYTLN